MVNINLKIDPSEEKKNISPVTAGMVLGGILLLLLIAYGGLLFYKSRLDMQAATINGEYGAKLESFKAGNAKNVFDFQNRLNNVVKLSDEKEKTADMLSIIEQTMVPDLYVDSLEYDKAKGEIKLSLNAKNYNGMAKQLLKFKNSGYFSDIQVVSSQVTEKGVKFPVTLVIK